MIILSKEKEETSMDRKEESSTAVMKTPIT